MRKPITRDLVMRPLLFARLLGVLAIGGTVTVAAETPRLTVASPFAVGGHVDYTLQGEPGAAWTIFVAPSPARESLGPEDTLFVDKDTMSVAASGTLDGAGTASASVTLAGATNRLWYAQARIDTAQSSRFSNAVTARIASNAPAGPRESVSVVVTPDGAKAYVGHEIDGSVSVVDLAAGAKLGELPVTIPANLIPYIPLDLAVDPDGRHLYVVNAAADRLAVVDVATDSTVAQLRVPRGSRRVGFDFDGAFPRIYVTNEVVNAILVFEERAPGRFTRLANIPLLGDDPTSLLVLPDGRLVVGNRATHDLEFVDPLAPPGSTTLARTNVQGLPHDIAFAAGTIFVPVFQPVTGIEGANRVLRVSPATFAVQGFLFENIGTDYVDIATSDELIAIVAASTGTVLFADPVSGAVVDNIELAPGDPSATPQEAAFAMAGGTPAKLYAVDYFRETLRPIELAGGPPFPIEPEIALAWFGAPRVPLSGDLSPEEDGDWFIRSVNLFGGTAFNPNRVTCYSCHIDGASDNVKRGTVPPPLWGIAQTSPWGQTGQGTNLNGQILGAMNTHNHTGLPNAPGASQLILAFFQGLQPPVSLYRSVDGALSPAARRGKLVFEGPAGCTTCHAAPLFIPPPPSPLTIQAGIGTGLVPANVPSLRGVWALSPYLANATARTLREVLTLNPNDRHGQLAAGLSSEQIDQLVAYLESL
jgi:YVTN family beta-propeller protein